MSEGTGQSRPIIVLTHTALDPDEDLSVGAFSVSQRAEWHPRDQC